MRSQEAFKPTSAVVGSVLLSRFDELYERSLIEN